MSNIGLKRPTIKSIVRDNIDNYTGKVIRVLDYKQATSWMDRHTLIEFNKDQEAKLGEGFRDLYFELYVQLEEVADDGRYQTNQIVHVSWEEVQDMDVIAWESEK